MRLVSHITFNVNKLYRDDTKNEKQKQKHKKERMSFAKSKKWLHLMGLIMCNF